MMVPLKTTSDLISSPLQAATMPTATALLALIPSVHALYDRFLTVIIHPRPFSPTVFVAAMTACLTPSFQSSLTIEPPPRLISLNWTVGPSCHESLSIWRRCSGRLRSGHQRAHPVPAPLQHDG